MLSELNAKPVGSGSEHFVNLKTLLFSSVGFEPANGKYTYSTTKSQLT